MEYEIEKILGYRESTYIIRCKYTYIDIIKLWEKKRFIGKSHDEMQYT